MKILFSKTAYTLIELIVSLLLTSVVILGIYSIDMVLNNNHQDYGQRYLVKSETQATLNHILNNASLAVGSGQANDKGILYSGNYAGFDPYTFCIHQPPKANIILSPNTGYNTDIWLCYTYTPATYQINWCAETYSAGADPRGASSCSSSTHILSGPTFLGTAYNNPTFAFSATTEFSITINNCLTNSAGSCSPTGTSSDPVNNPEVQISGSVFPAQYGTG